MTTVVEPPAPAASGQAIELRGIGKRFPGVIANHDVDITIRQRHHPRAGRGERRRQVHADEDPVRRAEARRRHHQRQRDRGDLRDAGRRDRPGHRDGLPALHAGRQPDRAGERHARRREAARHRRRGPCRDRRHLQALRLRARPRRAGGDPRRRRAPAGRDPQGALPRREDHHPRRADGRAGAAGGGRALRQPAPAQGAGPHPDLHLPQARRGARRSPTTSPSSAAAPRWRR